MALPLLIGILGWMSAGPLFAQDAAGTPEQIAFFESRIRPVLVEKCSKCHSSEGEHEGNLVLDSRNGLLQGGDRGAVISGKDPNKSLLIQAIRWQDPDLKMPPADGGGKLSDSQIADFEQWVASGAFDPRVETRSGPLKSWRERFQERLDWWSLKPVAVSTAPSVANAEWNNSTLDRFLFHAMQERGVTPADEADAHTLVRRATVVLTGLPPNRSEVESFVAQHAANADGAYEQLIDRLLSSERFGERFCKHWLDVVRFTETHGNEWNYDVPYAYRYRDYMIRAFNADIPFDQLVREHIAGDLLPSPRRSETDGSNESIIGTAFYRFGEVNHDSCTQFPIIGYDIADNQVDTLTKAFQASTVACARCHDHKLDALSTKDYHAILAIVRSTRSVQHTLNAPDCNESARDRLKELKRRIRSELVDVWRQSADQLDADKLDQALARSKGKAPTIEQPIYAWYRAKKASAASSSLADNWSAFMAELEAEAKSRVDFNATHFENIADLRVGIPAGWTKDGMGLRDNASRDGVPSATNAGEPQFVLEHEGELAIKSVLPRGIFTSLLSQKLNGALRSSELTRLRGKVSFEVIGGGFSLARIVFNNCQLNYAHQHSLHHPEWTWVTVDCPTDTEALHPYIELLTYWDNPKFPDPLGTLSKDVENQRLPFEEHAKNPRTWWGVRRIVAHKESAPPKAELDFLLPLVRRPVPADSNDVASLYRAYTAECIDAFANYDLSDDRALWLDWCVRDGLLNNLVSATPRLRELIEVYRAIDADDIALPMTMPGVADEGDGFDQPVLLRGDYSKPGEIVDRRFLEALDPNGQTKVCRGSGRAMLAERIACAENPLTARVIVNRLWLWLYGEGVVRTPDDFGHLGSIPSHPELLDHLADQFVQSGWSIKSLIRSIMTSRAFRSASSPTATARDLDPENILLSHYPARRVEAEVIRDSLLAISGRLDSKMFGPSIPPYREKADTEKRLYAGPLDGYGRRSLYLKFQLMEAPRFLSAFNLPGGKVSQGKRDGSNVPAQSLALLNDPFVWAMAEQWSDRALRDAATCPAERVQTMFKDALSRPASELELQRFTQAVSNFSVLHKVDTNDVMQSQVVWRELAHTLFNLKEFITIP